jgi:hypothetical protein
MLVFCAAAGCGGSTDDEADAGDAGDDAGDTGGEDLENPLVSMDNVAAYQGVSGAFGVEVTATDDVGIAQVDLLVDGVVAASSSADPFTISWDTTALDDASIVEIAARATDLAGKTAETAPVTVVVVNDGYPIEFTDGFSGEVVIPEDYTGTTEVDKKHHWIAEAGGASHILSIVVFTLPEGQADWALALEVGTGYCPDSGETLDMMAVDPLADGPVVYDAVAAEPFPGGGQMFYHLRPDAPLDHLGFSVGYEIHAYSFN